MLGDNDGIKADCLSKVRQGAKALRNVAQSVKTQIANLNYSDAQLDAAFGSEKSAFLSDKSAVDSACTALLTSTPIPQGN